MLELNVSDGLETVQIRLPVTDANEPAHPMYNDGDTDTRLERYIQRSLETSSGAFGHTIDPKSITPIDLHYALGQMGLVIEIVEGAEMVEEYNPAIPEGALT